MRVACIQLCSGINRQANIAAVQAQLTRAAEEGAQLALLPENFVYMGGNDDEKRHIAEHQGHSPTLGFLSKQAEKHQMFIVGGTLLLKGKGGLIRNACPVFDCSGELIAMYDKIHLFDMDYKGESYRESALVEAGNSPTVIQLDDFKLGLSVCYDIRFPELFRLYSFQGCHIICLVAAFTEPTGRAHWESLLRARAIENQCYVLASAQWGVHPDGRKTWGHSMIVDPWGEILVELPQGEGLISFDLSLDRIQYIRESLPTLKQRKLFLTQLD